MSYSGGTFSINSSGQPVVTGTVISSTAFNALTADLATGLSTCILKDGTQTLTANIPMGGFVLTGLGAGSTAGHSVRYEQVLLLAGGTLTGNLLFTDATYDIGASGATRPRDLFLSRNLVAGGTINVTGHTTFEGVTSTGATGTGKLVYDGTPTLVTPLLGTPTSGTLTNCTGLPVAGISNFSQITNSLSGSDVALNNTANFFDGPSIAQGTSGTWWAAGTVSLVDTTGGAVFYAKLWDGTTVIASSISQSSGAGAGITVSLSGYLATPAANIRISVRDITNTTGKILKDGTGAAKDSTVSAFRIA